MIDATVVLAAMAVAALVTLVVSSACRALAGRFQAVRALTGPVPPAIGIVGGLVALGIRPALPLASDQQRLAFAVIPIAALAGTLARIAPSGVARVLPRAIAAWAVCPVLLFGSIYLGTVDDGAPAEWVGASGIVRFAAIGLVLFLALESLLALDRQGAGTSVLAGLTLTALVAGPCIMLSGYLTGGLVAFPMAAAMAISAIASARPAGSSDRAGAVIIAFLALAGLVVIGHFFGSLSPGHALLLLAAPSAGWLAAPGRAAKDRSWRRSALGMGATMVLLGAVIHDVRGRFVAATTAAAPSQADAAPVLDASLPDGDSPAELPPE